VVLGRSINFFISQQSDTFASGEKKRELSDAMMQKYHKEEDGLGSLKSRVGDDDDEDGSKKILEAQSTEKCIA
jgi:hypothetical protein